MDTTESNKDKPRRYSWPKGVSGNPSGRPKLVEEARKLALAKAPEMIAVLERIALDPKAKNSERIAAAIAVLNRGLGMPPQAVYAKMEGGLQLDGMTVQERILALVATTQRRDDDEPPAEREGDDAKVLCDEEIIEIDDAPAKPNTNNL